MSNISKNIANHRIYQKPISLIGMAGSGKSSFGKYIATKLKSRFIDTDQLIEQKIGISIRQIFSQYGEDYFRKAEEDVIINLFDNLNNHHSHCNHLNYNTHDHYNNYSNYDHNNHSNYDHHKQCYNNHNSDHHYSNHLDYNNHLIIATGGGAFLQPKIRDILLCNTHVIWLRVNIDLLLIRLNYQEEILKRPIFTSKKMSVKENLKEMIDKRYPLYSKAHYIIDCNKDLSYMSMYETLLSLIK